MKIKQTINKYLLVLALLLLNITIHAQTLNTDYATEINSMFAGVDKNKVPHKLLLDYAMEFAELSNYNGTITTDNVVHRGTYTAIYNTLLMARVKTGVTSLVNPTLFKNNWDNARQLDKIVLSGLYYKYSKLKSDAHPNYITVTNDKLYDKYVNGVWQNPYDEAQVFAVASPITTYSGLSVAVELPSNLWYTNQTSSVQSIAIDFGDGNGYQTVAFGQTKTVSYTQKGLYEWKYKLTLTNNQILYAHSKINMDGEIPPNNNNQSIGNRTINEPCSVDAFGIDKVEFVGTQTYLGTANTATLEIDYRTGSDCILTKPLIVAEGFDSGLLGNENGLGDNFLRDFREDYSLSTGNLAGEISDYDIIYVNWDKGRDHLQRNALLLEDIIAWVNSVKTTSTPNIVLGQSMGGVIARYALADMEERSLTHDTSLYISHDAPHQGANIPLSVLYFARHMVDQLVSTPLGDINLNPNDSGAVSIEDIEELIDAPGTQQLLSNSVTSNFSVSTTLHDTWQADLLSNGLSGSNGYPQLTRNISLSNGSHCADPQDFSPSDTLFSLDGEAKTGLLTDFLIELLNPLGIVNNLTFIGLAVVFNEPGLLIGILPGNSKFEMNFNAKALPNVGPATNIYKGKIKFTKKILWIKITVDLTDRSYNSPVSILSYDYYAGGRYRVPFNFPNSSASGLLGSYNISAFIIPEGFDFIPVPSALDVGNGTTSLNEYDYLRTYTAANPPTGSKSIPFDNFMTSNQQGNSLNEIHISFNTRNGNWLATELDSDQNNQDLFDCTLFCEDARITGSSSLCSTTGTYSVTNEATTLTWWISQGANLVTTSTSGNSITLTQNNTNQSGTITLNATYGNDKCGSVTVSKTIKVGKPSFPTTQMTGDDNVAEGQYEWYSVPAATNATSYQWLFDVGGVQYTTINGWEVNVDQGTSAFIKVGSSDVVVVCKATNSCGSSTKYMYVSVNPPGGGGGDDPCDDSLRLSSNPMKSGSSTNKVIIDPCDDPGVPTRMSVEEVEKYTIAIYDRYNIKVYSKTQKDKEFDIPKLRRGFYVVKYQTKLGTIISEKLILE